MINDILELQLKDIQASERMVECLELRLSLLKTNFAKKDEYEKNEVEILKMQTEAQAERLKILINERKFEFKESYGRLIEELEFAYKNIE
jgi:hypothetical protein